MNGQNATVLVIGAGFSRAFVPLSPLLVDFYDFEPLARRFQGFAAARSILELEAGPSAKGRVNIERLMSRLDGLMPYDYEMGRDVELTLLLRELKNVFLNRVYTSKQGQQPHEAELGAFAEACVNRSITCVTFNYDDILDERLWKVHGVLGPTSEPYWHPDGGYGFYCRPSETCIRDINFFMDETSMYLLKLHGSVNWRIKRGVGVPAGVADLVHDEEWYPSLGRKPGDGQRIRNHLNDEPLIVPPVLTKSGLSREPVLRLIWHLAHDELASASTVTFVGYSLPTTDLAARFLFSEALRNTDRGSIRVVNFARAADERRTIIESYRSLLPELQEDQFDFRGAVEWSRDFVRGQATP